jgi:hypothetical protein
VATTRDGAEDLLARLRALLSARNAGTGANGTAGPRVLVVLDRRLGIRPDDPALVDAGRHGIHLVYLMRPGEFVPHHLSTLDLKSDLTACRYGRIGFPFVEGIPDDVSPGYVRELVDLLPDD